MKPGASELDIYLGPHAQGPSAWASLRVGAYGLEHINSVSNEKPCNGLGPPERQPQ